MTSDTGYIEDLLNEEDQDIFAESPRAEEAGFGKLVKADSMRERRKDFDSNAFSNHEPLRQKKVEYKSQQQSQKLHKSLPPRQPRRIRAKHFVIRSANMENVQMSYDQGGWATTFRNEPKLVEAFQTAENVYLIFSVNQSGHFQGYARMTTMPGELGRNIRWNGSQYVGKSFGVEWECWCELPYEQTLDLRNPWNENKPVKISRDGQDLPTEIGDELISRMLECAKQHGGPPPNQHRSAPPGKPSGGRPGFHNRGNRHGGNFDGFMDRPMGPGMMDNFEMGMEGPMGPMGPGMGRMGMGPGIGPMGMRPMMPGMMPGDGPMMDMMGGGMGMGPMMDGPMRGGMMMDPMNMRRNMAMNSMGMPGSASGPNRNHSPASFNTANGVMGGVGPMGGSNGGPYHMQNRGGSSMLGSRRDDHSHRDRSPIPAQERGRSPERRGRSESRGRVHSRSRSRSNSRGRAPNLMDMSYDEYLEHYKKVQRRMREMQEMKMSSQGNMNGSSNMMGANMFGGMMNMTGMNPMMSGMNQMMGAGMVPNMGMMYNNMGMMNRTGIMSEAEYLKMCARYFASHGQPCPSEEKMRNYYREMKAKYERSLKQA